MIFFTSDTHFGHNNIIKYCDRPFSTIDEMNDALIKNWNERVSSNDQVYVLGDFIWTSCSREFVLDIIHRLNGEIHLVRGSHDNEVHIEIMKSYGVRDLGPQCVIPSKYSCNWITLNHYPMYKWPASHYNAKHLFGHCHGSLESIDTGQSFDVGVDCYSYSPWSIDEVLLKLKDLNDNFDYHPPKETK